MKKYVIWCQDEKQKVYVKTTSSGTEYVLDKADATPLFGRAVASCVCNAIKPAIKKNGLNVSIGFELL